MFRSIRRSISLVFIFAAVAGAPSAVAVAPSDGAGAQFNVDDYRLAATATTTASSSTNPCSDTTYSLMGAKWGQTLEWSFRASSTPAGIARSAAQTTLQRAFSNIVSGRNNCGRSDRVSATARYLGTTGQRPTCGVMDGQNVVGFRGLPDTTLAQTCWWYLDGRIVEIDIQINSRLPWATSLADCRNEYMLEAVMTHEVGHAFGVGHVGERRHGRQTMSTHLDGACNNQEATLGLGDLLALEALY